MNTIPTPECDAAECEAHIGVSSFDHADIVEAYNFARSLERRLAVAVEALMAVGNQRIGKAGIADALAQIERMKHERHAKNGRGG